MNHPHFYRLRLLGFFLVAAAWASASALRAAEVAPAPIVSVRGEATRLSPDKPQVWAKGTRLRQLQTLAPGHGTPAAHAVVADSIVVRQGERVLVRDRDYLADPVWGSLGIAPGSSVTPDDEVTVDYCYSLRRIDSQIKTADGETTIRVGEPHLTIPLPPPLGPGEVRVANLFVDYHGDGTDARVFPVQETAEQATTQTTPGRIPKTLAKIAVGQAVKIVCWGDSVTAGGDASSPSTRYPAVFQKRLQAKYPGAPIRVETIAVGGSHSRQWLSPERFPGRPGCDWQRIAEARPNLVTIEFVNDASLSPEQVDEVYGEILRRLGEIESEVILITPHFTMPAMMGFGSLREPERRPYVLALRKFAASHGLALADASARWEHLWKEGIPYVTLLRNGINHPDDRGHALFADELMRCFEARSGERGTR